MLDRDYYDRKRHILFTFVKIVVIISQSHDLPSSLANTFDAFIRSFSDGRGTSIKCRNFFFFILPRRFNVCVFGSSPLLLVDEPTESYRDLSNVYEDGCVADSFGSISRLKIGELTIAIHNHKNGKQKKKFCLNYWHVMRMK